MDGVERRIPKRWTEAEDEVLYREARSQLATGQVKDWNRIAAKLPGRTNKDCRKRWINKVCGSLKKGAWDEDEDERLREAVRVHGQKWAVIANIVGLRSPDQCAKRWQYSLDPRLEHGGWESKEDEILLNLVQTHGRDWKLIQEQEFPTRSRNELKNRYSTLIRRMNPHGKNSSCSSSVGSPAPDGSINGDPRSRANSKGSDKPSQRNDRANSNSNSNITNNHNSTDGDIPMQWADEQRNDNVLHMDNWVASLHNDDWLQHFGTPVTGSPTSAMLAASEGASTVSGTISLDKLLTPPQHAGANATLTAPMDPSEALQASGAVTSAAQWPQTTTMAEVTEPSFLHMDAPDWNDTSNDLLKVVHMHDDVMVTEGSVGDSVDQAGMETGSSHDSLLLQDMSARRVSLVVDGCDTSTLDYLLTCVKDIKARVKLEIGN
ncbi:Transcriptional regulator [Paramyrothecium foliicola]|nr:Transcriptional regulator [Paramyrothecium foliicola]